MLNGHRERCETENANFSYRKLFTPRLNDFLIRKFYIYLSHLSHKEKTAFASMPFLPRK